MYKKLCYLTSFVLMLSLVGNAATADTYWTGAGVGNSWDTPANWNNGVPSSSVIFYLDVPGQTTEIGSGVNAFSARGTVGHSTGLCTLDITGGSLTASDTVWVGGNNGGVGVLNMSSGTFSVVGGYGNIVMCQNAGSTGTINMTGGTMSCISTLYLWDGDAQFNLHGGLVNASDLQIKPWNNLDITAGTLKLAGDKRSTIETYMDGRITGYGGNSWITADYNSVENKTTVTVNRTLACSPYPQHTATDIPADVVLSWVPGYYAPDTNGHRIYFSANEQDVIDGALAAYQGIQSETQFDTAPLNLHLNTDYYWRIDEANLSTGWDEGAVWKFTVTDYIILDDFDKYTDTNDLLLSWDDGDENGSKAQISLEKNIAQDGNSLKYVYDTNGWPFRAKAELVFDSAKNWAETGMEVLEIWFRGEADNDAEQMRVIIEDACSNIAMVKYNSDINDVKSQWWRQWDISVEDFNSAGIDLKNVTKFTIEFFSTPLKFARGTVYFDNIRLGLGPYKCVPLANDINGDCVVDFRDLKIMTDDWLVSGEEYYLAEQTQSASCSSSFNYHCYEEIDPSYASFDVPSLIHIADVNDAERIRDDIINYFWTEEGWPGDKMPVNIEYDINPRPDWATSTNIKRVDRIDIEMDYQMHCYVYHAHPKVSINRLLILQQGHTSDFGTIGVGNTANFFLDNGYSIMGYMMPLLGGENSTIAYGVPGYGTVYLSGHGSMATYLENSRGSFIRFFIEPIVVGINYAEDAYNYRDINMAGISGGGWTVHVCAAVEPRIGYSFPVAGAFPMYLRYGPCPNGSLGDAEQWWAPLYEDVASWLDIFILGGYGTGRQQVQVLNQYDSCCFGGINYRTYEPYVEDGVENLGSGTFRIYLDKSHCSHQISDIVINEVIYPLISAKGADLNKDGRADLKDFAIIANDWLETH